MTNRVTDDTRRSSIALCGAVRNWDRDQVHKTLSGADLEAMCVVLAAMVPPGSTASERLAWVDEYPEAIHPTVDVSALAGRSLVLAAAVRNWDYSRVADILTTERLDAMAVVLAAMVPDDQPVEKMLAWTDEEVATRFAGDLTPSQAEANLRRLTAAVA